WRTPNLRSYQASAAASFPDRPENVVPGSTIPSKLPPMVPSDRVRARKPRLMVCRPDWRRSMTVDGRPSAVSCWLTASTAELRSVTTSTLRFTPPCGATAGAALAGVGGGVILTVGGPWAEFLEQAAATMATAVRAAASRTTADRGLLEIPTMTPALYARRACTPVESPPRGQAEDGPPCRHSYHIANSDHLIINQ